MTLHLACLEASCASNNNSWCSPSCLREVSCVVRAVDTIDGQLFIDLISKVEGEDGLRASIHQTFHWSTNSVHKIEQGKWNIKPCRRFRQNLFREYENLSPDTLVTSVKV